VMPRRVFDSDWSKQNALKLSWQHSKTIRGSHKDQGLKQT